jgi:predicted RNase H-like HicB family nuclease
MQTTILDYRIIIEPDTYTGSNKPCFTAVCPTLDVSDGGDTIDEALEHIKTAIQVYVQSLIDDKKPVPTEQTNEQVVTQTQIKVQGNFQFA